jgi:hypothetical protein
MFNRPLSKLYSVIKLLRRSGAQILMYLKYIAVFRSVYSLHFICQSEFGKRSNIVMIMSMLKTGKPSITSGDGLIYPRGIVVGKVKKEGYSMKVLINLKISSLDLLTCPSCRVFSVILLNTYLPICTNQDLI